MRDEAELYRMSPDLYLRRLERLDDHIAAAMSSIYRAALSVPAVAVALLGIVGTRDFEDDLEQIAFSGLALLAIVVMLFAVRQMLTVFVLAGQRRAVEDYIDDNHIVHPGVFSWERGPARELSGALRLDGRWNPARFLEPTLASGVLVLVCGCALWQLSEHGFGSFWFVSVALTSVSSTVLIALAYRYIPGAMERVYAWTTQELHGLQTLSDRATREDEGE